MSAMVTNFPISKLMPIVALRSNFKNFLIPPIAVTVIFLIKDTFLNYILFNFLIVTFKRYFMLPSEKDCVA